MDRTSSASRDRYESPPRHNSKSISQKRSAEEELNNKMAEHMRKKSRLSQSANSQSGSSRPLQTLNGSAQLTSNGHHHWSTSGSSTVPSRMQSDAHNEHDTPADDADAVDAGDGNTTVHADNNARSSHHGDDPYPVLELLPDHMLWVSQTVFCHHFDICLVLSLLINC